MALATAVTQLLPPKNYNKGMDHCLPFSVMAPAFSAVIISTLGNQWSIELIYGNQLPQRPSLCLLPTITANISKRSEAHSCGGLVKDDYQKQVLQLYSLWFLASCIHRPSGEGK
ncbi:unnamed protein product [Caretta caretta]